MSGFLFRRFGCRAICSPSFCTVHDCLSGARAVSAAVTGFPLVLGKLGLGGCGKAHLFCAHKQASGSSAVHGGGKRRCSGMRNHIKSRHMWEGKLNGPAQVCIEALRRLAIGEPAVDRSKQFESLLLIAPEPRHGAHRRAQLRGLCLLLTPKAGAPGAALHDQQQRNRSASSHSRDRTKNGQEAYR